MLGERSDCLGLGQAVGTERCIDTTQQIAVGGTEKRIQVAEQQGEEQIVDRFGTASTHLTWNIHEGRQVIIDDVLPSQHKNLAVGIGLVGILLLGELTVLQFPVLPQFCRGSAPK